MRILVAGGTGVLGRPIVAGLAAGGHEVTVLVRASPRSADQAERLAQRGIGTVLGDALDADRLRVVVGQVRPEVLLHQLTDLSERSGAANARLRVQGTGNLVDAALAAGTLRIVLQSIAWIYGPGPGPADESADLDRDADDPARRTTVDAVVAMESRAAELPECVVLRNGLLYGPGTWYAPDGAFGVAARDGRLGADGAVSSFVHVEDAAAAAVAALGWPAGVVNVVDDEPAPGWSWGPQFCAAVGAPAPAPEPADGRPGATAPRPGWARGADNARARSLGWTPRFPSWREGFRSGF